MDAFADNFDQPEVDPAAEFLAREKDQLAGLEDDLAVDASQAAAPAAALSSGGGGSATLLDSGMWIMVGATRARIDMGKCFWS